MWEQVKRAMVESAREVCGSARVGRGNLKNVWWNDQVKAAVDRKEVLGTRDEDAKEMFWEVYKEEKRKVKRSIYQSRKEVQEQFERKMNQDVNGNRKLFWKRVNNANEGKGENSNRIKDGNGRLALGEDEVPKIWKEYFEDLYNIDTQERARGREEISVTF